MRTIRPVESQALRGLSVLNWKGYVDPRLSTASLCGALGDGSGTEVASTDDIHIPVENSDNTQKPHKHEEGSAKTPPGEFVSDELEEHTKRFLEEVKGRTKASARGVR